MNTEQCASNANICKRVCGIKCISWSSIIAGAFVAIGLSFLLNLFSAAIGLSIYKISPEGVNKLAAGGMLGFAIGIIASMFFAGWIAGYFGRSHCSKKCCGALYGLTTWCVALIIMIMLALPFSRFITGYTNYLSNKAVVTTIEPIESNTTKKASITVQSEATLDDLSKGAFVLFLMFFLGALASTCGGHAGVSACQNKECCVSACKCNKCCK
jgi:MFS family permease